MKYKVIVLLDPIAANPICPVTLVLLSISIESSSDFDVYSNLANFNWQYASVKIFVDNLGVADKSQHISYAIFLVHFIKKIRKESRKNNVLMKISAVSSVF